jgi:hypothetical protein
VVCRLGRPCRHGLGDRIRCSAVDSTSEPITGSLTTRHPRLESRAALFSSIAQLLC